MNEEERRLRRSSKEVRVNPEKQVPEMEKSGGGRYRIELDIDESRELTEAQKHAILNILVTNSTRKKTSSNQRGATMDEGYKQPSENRQRHQAKGKHPKEQRLQETNEESFLDEDLPGNTRTAVIFVAGVIVGVALILIGTNF